MIVFRQFIQYDISCILFFKDRHRNGSLDAAEGETAVTTAVARRVHASAMKVEEVRVVSTRGVRSRRPVITVAAGAGQAPHVYIDAPAADEVERAPSDIITTSGDGRSKTVLTKEIVERTRKMERTIRGQK